MRVLTVSCRHTCTEILKSNSDMSSIFEETIIASTSERAFWEQSIPWKAMSRSEDEIRRARYSKLVSLVGGAIERVDGRRRGGGVVEQWCLPKGLRSAFAEWLDAVLVVYQLWVPRAVDCIAIDAEPANLCARVLQDVEFLTNEMKQKELMNKIILYYMVIDS